MRSAKGQSPNRVVDHLFLSNPPSRLRLFLRTMLASRMSSQLSRLLLLRNKPSLPSVMKTCLLFSPPLPLAFLLYNRNHPLLPDCLGCFFFLFCFVFFCCNCTALIINEISTCSLSCLLSFMIYMLYTMLFLFLPMLFLLFNDAKRGKKSEKPIDKTY